MGTTSDERDLGLLHIDRIRRIQLGQTETEAAPEPHAAVVTEPEPEPRAHADDCPFCQRLACWACEYNRTPLDQCRHGEAARHGGGDLTNPPKPEEPGEE